MIRRIGLAILVLFLLVLGGVVAPGEVQACSVAGLEPGDRLPTFVEQATVVVVGEVVAREPAERGHGEDVAFSAVGVLAGDPPAEITLRGIGDLGADCRGGPPLPDGERFLLFLTNLNIYGAVSPTRPDELRIVHVGLGVYRLADGEALHYSGYYEQPREDSQGPSDVFIRAVGERLGSDPAEVERAIAFANGAEAPPRVAVEESNPVTVWGSVGVGVIAVGVLVGWYVRGRSRRRG